MRSFDLVIRAYGLRNACKELFCCLKGTIMGHVCGKQGCYMELVAYHIYHSERRYEVIPWWEVTPDMVAKYEAFAQGLEGYLHKKEDPDKIFVQQRWERVMKPKDFTPTPQMKTFTNSHFFFLYKKNNGTLQTPNHNFSLIVNGRWCLLCSIFKCICNVLCMILFILISLKIEHEYVFPLDSDSITLSFNKNYSCSIL